MNVHVDNDRSTELCYFVVGEASRLLSQNSRLVTFMSIKSTSEDALI